MKRVKVIIEMEVEEVLCKKDIIGTIRDLESDIDGILIHHIKILDDKPND